jgi:hypothetical protein
MLSTANQKDGQLFVDTGESLVSGYGTVFSVTNGTVQSALY